MYTISNLIMPKDIENSGFLLDTFLIEKFYLEIFFANSVETHLRSTFCLKNFPFSSFENISIHKPNEWKTCKYLNYLK